MGISHLDVDRSVTYAELRASGMSRRRIEAAVRSGSLVRSRRGRYLSAVAHPELRAAAVLGGRLDCVSLLRLLKVFVHERHGTHLQFDRTASRVPPRGAGVRAHWRDTAADPDELTTGVVEALVQACRCQAPRSTVATLDSAWHAGLVDESEIAEVFDRLPARFRVLRPLLDRRSEAGTESLVRLVLRSLGCSIEVQADVEGVGRVDFLVDGWLIVECDSQQFHSDWSAQRKDRRRDVAAAVRGYVTLRLIAEDILFAPELVRAALVGLLEKRG
jgi:very-short-patch-repair endonuclease